jgi:hypothetical protein
MTDFFSPAAQRAALLKFAGMIESTSRALQKDGCGDPYIEGKRGFAYAAPEGFYLFFTRTPREWTYTERVMGFAKVTQDGDDEGFLLMRRLPTADEAAVIRDQLGIRRRPHLTDEARERLRARAFGGFQREKSAPKIPPVSFPFGRLAPAQRISQHRKKEAAIGLMHSRNLG